MKHLLVLLSVAVMCAMGAGSLTAAPPTQWPQWSQDPQHAGMVQNLGQPLNHILADIVYDPFVPDEMAAGGDDLLVHYQVPLLDGNDVYMEFKGGNFTTIPHWETQDWMEKKLTWQGSSLVEVWSHTSTWKPVPAFSHVSFNGPAWEPVYQPVLVGDFLYVPMV